MGTDEPSTVLERAPFCVLPRMPELDDHHAHHQHRRPHLPPPGHFAGSPFPPPTGLPSPPQPAAPPHPSTTKRAWAVVNPPEQPPSAGYAPPPSIAERLRTEGASSDHHHHKHYASRGPSSTSQPVSQLSQLSQQASTPQPAASTRLPPISPPADQRPSPERTASTKRQRLSPPPCPSLLRNPSLVPAHPPAATQPQPSPAHISQPPTSYSAGPPVPAFSTGAVFQSGQAAHQAPAPPPAPPASISQPRQRTRAPSRPKAAKVRFASPQQPAAMGSSPRSPARSPPAGPSAERGRPARPDPVKDEIAQSRAQQAASTTPPVASPPSRPMDPPPPPRQFSPTPFHRSPRSDICDKCMRNSVAVLRDVVHQNRNSRNSGPSGTEHVLRAMESFSESLRNANKLSETRWRECSCNRPVYEDGDEPFDLTTEGPSGMRPPPKRGHSPSVFPADGEPSNKALRFSPEDSGSSSNGQYAARSSGSAPTGNISSAEADRAIGGFANGDRTPGQEEVERYIVRSARDHGFDLHKHDSSGPR